MSLPTSANILDFLTEATKEQSKLRLAIAGPSGSGKTFSGINILMEMGCERIVVIDTENGSVDKYASEFPRKFKRIGNDYWKSNFDPRRLIAALQQLGPHADGLVVDSLTHFWMGPGGMLELIEQIALKKAHGNAAKKDTWGAWKDGDKIYAQLIQTILSLPCHFVATLRAKSEYEDQEVNGRKKKVKVGMQAQVRDGFEYEFDVEGMMTMDHDFVVGKTRCSKIDGMVFNRPGKNLAEPLLEWLTDGVAPAKQDLTALSPPDPTPPPVSGPTIADAPANLDDDFVAKLTAADSLEALAAIRGEISAAKKNGQISDEAKLSKAYSARKAALTPPAVA